MLKIQLKKRKLKLQNQASNMVYKEHKREAVLHDKLKLLRSITKSHAMNESTIIADASHYIKELQNKVKILSEDVATSESSRNQNPWPEVTVETLEKGFSVNIQAGSTCPGLLAYILETFEELGLNVLEARVSCAENFYLLALGENEEDEEEIIDAQMVKQTISNAIKNWSEPAKRMNKNKLSPCKDMHVQVPDESLNNSVVEDH